ncbi:MAG: Gfo/Idh/MocA family oxidoreductase [Planctomycetes bacterium]|nr:Gfo/Idh/MocA family oxidoreductase [Planctomycetota bacterium]
MDMKLKRRDFLRRSAAAVAFPYIIGSSSLVRAEATNPSDKVTVGCIGVGGMGTGNLRGFLNTKDFQVVAVCDVDKRHRDRAKKLVDDKYSNTDCATYNEFEKVLARKDIDAVMLALPDHWHGVVSVAAARACKDIYGEKPLAYNIAEGRAVVDAVDKYDVIWQTGSWQRSQRHFRIAAELVRNGRIGKVHTVYVGLPWGNGKADIKDKMPSAVPQGFDYDRWLGPAPSAPYCVGRCHGRFRWNLDYSGGQLTDWAGHHVDIANWGMDTEMTSPTQIYDAIGKYPKGDPLYNTPFAYRFVCYYPKQNFRMIVSDSGQSPKGMGTYFVGDQGWVHVNRKGIDASSKSILKSKIKPDEIHLYTSYSHIGNFLDCIRNRKETIAPARVAHRSIMVAHLGRAALELGRDLKFDPIAERFEDSQANKLLSRPMRGPWHI